MKIREGDIRGRILQIRVAGEKPLEVVIVGQELGEHLLENRLTEFQRRKGADHVVVNRIERLLEIARE